jgi:hypothetical protein
MSVFSLHMMATFIQSNASDTEQTSLELLRKYMSNLDVSTSWRIVFKRKIYTLKMELQCAVT